MKILAFAASNSKQSINRQLVSYASGLLTDHQIEILDINDYELPIFSPEREEAMGRPALAQQFFKKIGDADVLIIAFAEHNGSYTAAYKNLFDWVSRIDQKVFQNKPMILLATSPGPGGAQNVLKQAATSAPFFGGELLAEFSLPKFYEHFSQETQRISDPALDAALRAALAKLPSHA